MIEIDEQNLKQGLLGLVITLVEIIRDMLRTQAIRRMNDGSLDLDEINRLGLALRDMDQAIEQIKQEHGLESVVADLRDGLDDVVDRTVGRLTDPRRWSDDGSELSSTQRYRGGGVSHRLE